MRIAFVLTYLFLAIIGIAQETSTDYKFSFAIRGKAFAGPTGPENMYGKMFTIGTEYRFAGKHSFGIDYVNFRNAHEDETLSSAGYYENAGTFNYVHRKYFLIDYRFYFYRHPNLDYNFAPYFNLLIKTGKQAEWYYNGIGPNENIPWFYYGTFFELGPAIGMRLGGKFFGADISLGFLQAHPTAEYGSTYITPRETKPHMRINLFFEPFHVRR